MVQTAYDDAIERRNLYLLRAHGIRCRQIIPTACPGYGWKHGTTDCPQRNQLSLRTLRLKWRPAKKYVEWEMLCSTCEFLRRLLHRWRKRGLYTADGSRLCTAARCFNTVADALDCEYHAGERRRRAIAQQLRRSQRRGANGGPAWRQRLWKVVSPADMGTFFGSLHALPEPGWLRREVWRTVADSMLLDAYAGPPVLFLDTESIRPRGHEPLILSISVVDAKGNTVLPPTTVDYGRRIGDLCQGITEGHRSYAVRMYKAHSGAAWTHGRTPQELVQVLKDLGLRRGSVLVEWSTSGWDWRAVKRLYGQDDDLPVTYAKGPDLLRAVGYSGPLNLMTVFYFLWPRSPLARVHHESDIDTFKLYAVVYHLLSRGRPLPAAIQDHVGEDDEAAPLPDAFWGEAPESHDPEDREDWEVSSDEEDSETGSDYMPSDEEEEE